MAAPAPQVRSSAYFPFVQFMEGIGAPVARGLEEPLMPAMVHQDPEMLVPVHLAHAFLERSARRLGAENFGFIVGREARIQGLGAFGRSVSRSLTLHDALGKLHSKFHLYSSAEQLSCTRSGSTVLFLHRHTHATGPGSRYAQQCALVLMRDLVRLAAGPAWQPDEVFSTNPSLDGPAIEEAFEGAVVKQSLRTGFAFPERFLSRPLIDTRRSGGDPDTASFESSAPAEDFVGSIKQVISALLRHGHCHVNDVAGAIGMHPRTMQRRLGETEHEYSEILMQVRFETAVRMMDDPRIGLTDIAYELGYGDPANFTRAFRQWTGVSPSRFRKLRGSPV